MSTQMLLYKNVTVLSRLKHKDLKLKPVDSAAFAAHAHWIPVVGAEFVQAACHYPIIFVSEGDDAPVMPILTLSFKGGSNSFVSEDGQWLQNYYIPAFIRRYPFVPVNVADKLDDAVACSDGVVVCIDSTWDGFNNEEGDALFAEDGSNDPFLDDVIQFMNDYQAETEYTLDFVATLQRFDLLKKTDLDVQSPDGATLKLSDILIVDEEKLSQLSGEQLSELNSFDYLSWIFAHLVSLGNFPKLLDLSAAGGEVAGASQTAQETAGVPEEATSIQEGNTL